MTTKNKPDIRESKIVHICTQEEVIAKQARELKSQTRLAKRNTILLDRVTRATLGNGHEEDGLLFIVRKFVKEHEIVLSDISEIKDKLSTVAEINTELEIKRRLHIEKEKIAKEARAEVEIELKKKTYTWGKVPIITGIITVFILLIFQILNYNVTRKTATKEEVKQVKEDVRDLGAPVIVNSRGNITSLPKGDSIKYFRNMEYQNFKDTTKK